MSYPIDTTTWRSPNYNSRSSTPITAIVVHSCEGSLPDPKQSSLPWLCNPSSNVSTHYYVCRDMSIYQLVSDANQAWHAGGQQDDGTWTAQQSYSNPHSIGIECEHRSGQDWPSVQLDTLSWLLRRLILTYAIRAAMIETHGQIAIAGPYSRKVDPSNWPHSDFVTWRNALYTALPRTYRVAGLPVYQRSDHTGPLWGYLAPGQTVVIDDPHNGHVSHVDGIAAGIGFVDIAGLVEPTS
jgi:hypothetical protein